MKWRKRLDDAQGEQHDERDEMDKGITASAILPIAPRLKIVQMQACSDVPLNVELACVFSTLQCEPNRLHNRLMMLRLAF